MTAETAPPRFQRLSAWLKARHGERVHKISLRGGFTCPNRDGTLGRGGCAFCAGDALEPVGYQAGRSVSEQLEQGMAYIRARHGSDKFIAYFQDYTATYGSPDRLAATWKPVLDFPEIVGLAVGTRPDCVGEPVLDLLARFARRMDLWVELGLQIANDDLLDRINRGHHVAAFTDAAARCAGRRLPVCAHVIIGLPGATPADERRTADLLAALGVWGVKLHAFHVIRGTPMARRHAAGQAPVLTQQAHVERVVDFLERLPPETVIHRVTGEAPRRLTVAPAWTVNKLRVYDAVVARLAARDTWQGRLVGATRPESKARSEP